MPTGDEVKTDRQSLKCPAAIDAESWMSSYGHQPQVWCPGFPDVACWTARYLDPSGSRMFGWQGRPRERGRCHNIA